MGVLASITGELTTMLLFRKKHIAIGKRLKAPLSCLSSARYGISWGALGAAMVAPAPCHEYSKERTQFGKPLAAFQLTQKN